LELVEKKYRDTPEGNKKYAKRLTDFIDFLILRGRIFEAKHFFDCLYKLKPNHARTIRLGYRLSIFLFNNESVKKFDKLLHDSKPSDIELVWFRLMYYHSVNDRKNCEDSCEYLFSKSIKNDYLNTIIEVCINQNNYAISVNLIRYLKKEKINLSDSGNKQIKKIVLQEFVDTIVKIKNG
jgi:hypothetical protein